jgi:hypothetical protein
MWARRRSRRAVPREPFLFGLDNCRGGPGRLFRGAAGTDAWAAARRGELDAPLRPAAHRNGGHSDGAAAAASAAADAAMSGAANASCGDGENSVGRGSSWPLWQQQQHQQQRQQGAHRWRRRRWQETALRTDQRCAPTVASVRTASSCLHDCWPEPRGWQKHWQHYHHQLRHLFRRQWRHQRKQHYQPVTSPAPATPQSPRNEAATVTPQPTGGNGRAGAFNPVDEGKHCSLPMLSRPSSARPRSLPQWSTCSTDWRAVLFALAFAATAPGRVVAEDTTEDNDDDDDDSGGKFRVRTRTLCVCVCVCWCSTSQSRDTCCSVSDPIAEASF